MTTLPARRLTAVLMLFLALSAGAADTASTTLTVKGMTCGGCVAAVRVQLRRTDGVIAYEVSLEKGEADVTYDPGRTDPHKIAESVSKTGFEATVKSARGKSAGPTRDGVTIASAASREPRRVSARHAHRS